MIAISQKSFILLFEFKEFFSTLNFKVVLPNKYLSVILSWGMPYYEGYNQIDMVLHMEVCCSFEICLIAKEKRDI